MKTLRIWAGVNKNGFVSIHAEEPKRGNGKWISDKPIVNSVLYNQLKDMFENTTYSWENDTEFFEIEIK